MVSELSAPQGHLDLAQYAVLGSIAHLATESRTGRLKAQPSRWDWVFAWPQLPQHCVLGYVHCVPAGRHRYRPPIVSRALEWKGNAATRFVTGRHHSVEHSLDARFEVVFAEADGRTEDLGEQKRALKPGAAVQHAVKLVDNVARTPPPHLALQ